jgi:hypothetical protein
MKSKVRDISLESRKPRLAMRASMRATVSGSEKEPSTPGSVKSINVLRNVAELTRSSPLAASQASSMAVRLPPRHRPTMLTLGAPVMSPMTSRAVRGPSSR